MKKLFCILMAAMMVFAAAACTGSGSGSGEGGSETAETIKVGILGPHTGEYAVYGLAVRNGAELYINQVNANGGVNGKQIELVIEDQRGDSTEAITAFSRMVDQGITALIGDVLTGNTLAVVGEAYPINMPMITASATAAAVTCELDSQGSVVNVYSNVFRTCFIDPFQGEKMAAYAAEVMNFSTAAIIVETGNDYAVGLAEAFKTKCAEVGITVVAEEGYASGDVDFRSQLTNIMAAAPDCVFCPNYYENDGMIIKQAREIGLTATFMGGDGWAGVTDYATAEELEGTLYCSAYAPGTTEAAVAFEAAYTEAYGADTLNMFAATAYDAAMVLVNALTVAEASGEETGSEAYKQAVIDAIRDNSGDLAGITSPDGYEFDANNNPIKSAVIMVVTGGVATFKEMY